MRKTTTFAIGLALLVTSCGVPNGNPLGFLSDSTNAANGNWVLVSASDSGSHMTIFDGQDITMTLNGGRINGRAACNSYSGAYTMQGDGSFRIVDGVAVTEMWCSDDATMAAERAFLDALQEVTAISFVEDRIVAIAGTVELHFENTGTALPEPGEHPDEPTTSELFPAEIRGSWVLSVGEVDGRVIPIVDGFPITLTIRSDGFGGRVCNEYGHEVPLPADGSFPHIVQTLMSCGEEVDGSEALFLDALGRFEQARVVGSQLVIRGENTQLTFDPS